MSAESNYLREEKERIEQTLVRIEELLGQTKLGQHKVVAFGTYLQNVYSGVERILRFLLERSGICIPHDETWHQALLQRSLTEKIVSTEEFVVLSDLRAYRHFHAHGYGYMLKEPRLRELAGPTVPTVREFLTRV